MNEENYRDAVEDMSLRGTFVKGVNLGVAKGFIKEVAYNSRAKEDIIMTCVNRPSLKSKVVIYPRAFDYEFHPNYEDFRCTLVHHEGFHASRKDTRGSVRPYMDAEGTIFIELMAEFRAIRNQINNFNERNSEHYKLRVIQKRDKLLRQIEMIRA